MTSTAPSASNVFTVVSRLSRSNTGASANAASATGMLTKKIHSHESASVSTPPSRTPAAAPKPPTAPQTPRAMFRSRPSANVVIRIASAAGETVAAPRPWIARAPISEVSDQASPQSSEPRAKMHEPGHEDAAASEDVRRAAAEQQEAAEHERVGGDHPLQVRLRDVEIQLDRGKCDVHDRDVEHDHELDRAEKRESEPFHPR